MYPFRAGSFFPYRSLFAETSTVIVDFFDAI